MYYQINLQNKCIYLEVILCAIIFGRHSAKKPKNNDSICVLLFKTPVRITCISPVNSGKMSSYCTLKLSSLLNVIATRCISLIGVIRLVSALSCKNSWSQLDW